MKRFSMKALAVFAFTATLLSFFSCQKESVVAPSENTATGNNIQWQPSDRSEDGYVFGVTVFQAGTPSQVIQLRDNNGSFIAAHTPWTPNALGIHINLVDLKGICRVADAYFITTGPNQPAPFANSLFKYDYVSEYAEYLSTSPNAIGAVSDIDYDPLTQKIYGLANNTNSVVVINGLGNNFTGYASAAVTGIANGYTLNGLTMMRDANGLYTVLAARRGNATTQLYSMPTPVAPGFNFVGLPVNLNPALQLTNNHCGIGFDIDYNHLMVNRNASFPAGFGLNDIAWPLPFGNNTAVWGGAGFNFEDLSTFIGKYW